MIDKAEHKNRGSNPRFVITNLPQPIADSQVNASPARSLGAFYDGLYCPRGEMENRVKEQQMCLFADRASCTDFIANRLRLLISSFAYILVDGIRRLAFSGTKAARWRADTIRLKVVKVSARVVVSVRRVMFHLCSNCPYQAEFKHVMERLCDTR